MKGIKLNSIKDHYFNEAWELYENSFPVDERRSFIVQSNVMKNPHYNFDVILKDDKFAGFILWWQFKNLRYIEHLATKPDIRGNGLGGMILKHFINQNEDPIILEVEPPDSEIKKRRINFYERPGFKLNNHNYIQPPLNINTLPVKLLLMSYPAKISSKEVSFFVNECHPVIFACSK